MSNTTLSFDDREKIMEFMDEATDNDESHYPNMTYEEGMRDMLAVFDGEVKVSELTGG